MVVICYCYLKIGTSRFFRIKLPGLGTCYVILLSDWSNRKQLFGCSLFYQREGRLQQKTFTICIVKVSKYDWIQLITGVDGEYFNFIIRLVIIPV